MIAGFEKPSVGRVLMDGREIEGPGHDKGFVFQSYMLFAWRTVRGNVEVGPRVRNLSREERRRLSQQYIDMVGLNGFEEHYPHQLSGGMKQRVGIARAYANSPNIMLLDEPFGQLDAQTRMFMQKETARIWEQEKRTVIFVTNNIDEALFLGDRIILMEGKLPGSIKTEYMIDLPAPRAHQHGAVEAPLHHHRQHGPGTVIWKRPPSASSSDPCARGWSGGRYRALSGAVRARPSQKHDAQRQCDDAPWERTGEVYRKLLYLRLASFALCILAAAALYFHLGTALAVGLRGSAAGCSSALSASAPGMFRPSARRRLKMPKRPPQGRHADVRNTIIVHAPTCIMIRVEGFSSVHFNLEEQVCVSRNSSVLFSLPHFAFRSLVWLSLKSSPKYPPLGWTNTKPS